MGNFFIRQSPNFENYTIDELRQYARKNNIRLAGSTRKADIINTINIALAPPYTGPSIFSTPLNEDLFYELAQPLTLANLRSLCSSNRHYRTLCQQARFHQMLKRKAAEEQGNPFYSALAQFMLNNVKLFRYQISRRDEGHYLIYNENRFEEEVATLTDENGQRYPDYTDQSILKTVFGNESRSTLDIYTMAPKYERENVTVEDMKQVLKVLLNKPYFDMDEFSVDLSAKELKQICEDSKEYEIVCLSRFYHQLIKYKEEVELGLMMVEKGFMLNNGNYSLKYTPHNYTVVETIRTDNGNPDELSLLSWLKLSTFPFAKRQISPDTWEYTTNAIDLQTLSGFSLLLKLIRQPGFDVNSITFL